MKTVIVGAGAIAYAHARACKETGIEIIGILDVRLESAERLASMYNTKALENIEDYEKAVSEADMVHLCTPPAMRISYAETAMKAGCHVITEKPIAIHIEDAETLMKLADKYDVELMVDYNHRFRDGFQALLKLVQSGELGDVISIVFNRNGMLGGNAGTKNDTWRRVPGMACGMSIESLSHDIDMIMQLGGNVESVIAQVKGTFPEVPEFDTNVNASFCMEKGVMASMQASWSSHLSYSLRGVIGSKGTAFLEGDNLFDFNRLRVRTADMPSEVCRNINDEYHLETCSSYTKATEHFLQVMRGECENTVSAQHALKTLKISYGILESAKSGSRKEII